MRRTYLAASVAIFSGILVLGWVTHGTGIVKNDPERNIFIPDELTTKLQVKVAYDKENIYFRYRWPVKRPSIFNNVLVYQDGKWVLKQGEEVGPSEDFLTEDRVAMMIDDGSVPLFSRYGGYITIGEGLTTFTGTPETREERTKYLPETRSDPGNFETIRPESDLETLRKAGYFIDLWQWRSSLSNPLSVGDDGLISAERGGDMGKSSFGSNWFRGLKQPKYMFNPDIAGNNALNFDDVVAGKYGFDDIYYLGPKTSVPFDPEFKWKNGDTLPSRYLRDEKGSRGDLVMPGPARWEKGFWDVTMSRKLDTGNPLDDKIFRDGGSYDLAFAVFRNASTMRWHYVSLPVSLGLGQDAQLIATKFDGGSPQWGQDWYNLTMFYPGQVNWPRLTNPKLHPGADRIKQRVPVAFRHKPEQLALYGVEVEFADQIRRQWLWTLFASLSLIIGLGVNINLLMIRRKH